MIYRRNRRGDRDSFLTMNSPNPADSPNDAVCGGNSASQIGVLVRAVWSAGVKEMLDHVTRDWRNHYVTADALSYDELQTFAVRPFVLIVRLDAPVLERFRRVTRYILDPPLWLTTLIPRLQVGKTPRLVGEIHRRP